MTSAWRSRARTVLTSLKKPFCVIRVTLVCPATFKDGDAVEKRCRKTECGSANEVRTLTYLVFVLQHLGDDKLKEHYFGGFVLGVIEADQIKQFVGRLRTLLKCSNKMGFQPK